MQGGAAADGAAADGAAVPTSTAGARGVLLVLHVPPQLGAAVTES
jgi:hypothetical protein